MTLRAILKFSHRPPPVYQIFVMTDPRNMIGNPFIREDFPDGGFAEELTSSAAIFTANGQTWTKLGNNTKNVADQIKVELDVEPAVVRARLSSGLRSHLR